MGIIEETAAQAGWRKAKKNRVQEQEAHGCQGRKFQPMRATDVSAADSGERGQGNAGADGPPSRLARRSAAPRITKDGVTVAKELNRRQSRELGADVREVARDQDRPETAPPQRPSWRTPLCARGHQAGRAG